MIKNALKQLYLRQRKKNSTPPPISEWDQGFVDKFLQHLRQNTSQLMRNGKLIQIKNGDIFIQMKRGLVTIIENDDIITRLIEEKTEQYLIREFEKSYIKRMELFSLKIKKITKEKLI